MFKTLKNRALYLAGYAAGKWAKVSKRANWNYARGYLAGWLGS